MKRCLFVMCLIAAAGLCTACGGGGGGDADPNANGANSNWDALVWDQDVWSN